MAILSITEKKIKYTPYLTPYTTLYLFYWVHITFFPEDITLLFLQL